jgi:hypothetical protein
VIYFATISTREIRTTLQQNKQTMGYITTPNSDRRGQIAELSGVKWCADNGCFSDNFDETKWWSWLSGKDPKGCLFAVAPDVVADHHATVARSMPWLPKIRALGFPAAFVIQDGATIDTVPWEACDAIFIGGTTEFKLSDAALEIIQAGKERGKWVHVGRVNSRRRFLRFAGIADSCDGTFLAFGPTRRLPELLGWVREHHTRIPLWEGA